MAGSSRRSCGASVSREVNEWPTKGAEQLEVIWRLQAAEGGHSGYLRSGRLCLRARSSATRRDNLLHRNHTVFRRRPLKKLREPASSIT